MSLPQLLTISEFCVWARIGRTKTYELIASGELTAIKIGRRTLIRFDHAAHWLETQPQALSTVEAV
jgi:excisionase family DNA binding protein